MISFSYEVTCIQVIHINILHFVLVSVVTGGYYFPYLTGNKQKGTACQHSQLLFYHARFRVKTPEGQGISEVYR